MWTFKETEVNTQLSRSVQCSLFVPQQKLTVFFFICGNFLTTWNAPEAAVPLTVFFSLLWTVLRVAELTIPVQNLHTEDLITNRFVIFNQHNSPILSFAPCRIRCSVLSWNTSSASFNDTRIRCRQATLLNMALMFAAELNGKRKKSFTVTYHSRLAIVKKNLTCFALQNMSFPLSL